MSTGVIDCITVVVRCGPGHEEAAPQAVESAHAAGFKKVILVDDTGGGGRSAAGNLGFAMADTDWVMILDADDLLLPDACDKIVRTFKRALVSPDIIYSDYIKCSFDECPDYPIKGEIEADRHQSPPYSRGAHKGFSIIPLHGTVMRRSAVLDAGGFDHTMDYAEDYDLLLKIALHGNVLKSIEGPFVLSRKGNHSSGPRGAGQEAGMRWNEAVAAVSKREKDEQYYSEKKWKRHLVGAKW